MAQIFPDSSYYVTILHRAFSDASPSNAVLNSQAAQAASLGIRPYALQFGADYASMSEDQLSTRILGNLGVMPNAGLQTALKDYLVSVGKANVGIVVLQLGEILVGLTHATGDQEVYKEAALAWNYELAASYLYSANPANTVPSPPGPPSLPVAGLSKSLTAGEDRVWLSDFDDTFLAPAAGLLSSADTLDGGYGNDTLKAILASAVSVSPVLTSVEKVFITADAGSEFNASRATGLLDLMIDAAAGAATFSGVSLSTTVGIQNSFAGGTLTVKFAGADGPSDTASIVFADATGGDEIIVASVEALNVKSTVGTVAATTVNSARITADQAQKIVISGDQAFSTTVTGAKLSTIDASALTKALGLALAPGGSAGVAITINAQAAHKITLGAGPDTLTIAGLSGTAAKDLDLSTSATLAASAIEVAGFVSGTDMIKLSSASVAAKAMPSSGELASITASSSLLDAATLAATTAGANRAIAFRYGADTYILVNDGTAALGENDSLVKLTGVAVLADASWPSV